MRANAKQRYNDAWARFYEERGMVNPDSTSTGEKTTNCTNAAQNKGDKISYVTNCQPLTSRRIKNIFKRSGIFLLDRWYAIVGIVIVIKAFDTGIFSKTSLLSISTSFPF